MNKKNIAYLLNISDFFNPGYGMNQSLGMPRIEKTPVEKLVDISEETRWLLFSDNTPYDVIHDILIFCSAVEFVSGKINTPSVIALTQNTYDFALDKANLEKLDVKNCLYDNTGNIACELPYDSNDFYMEVDADEILTYYKGPLPDIVVNRFAKDELMSEIVSSAYLGAFGAYERWDLPNPEMDPMPLLSCGRETLPWEVEFGRGPSAPAYESIVWLLDQNILDEMTSQSEYGKWTQKIRDLSRIWCSIQEQHLKGLRLPVQHSQRYRGPFSQEEFEKAAMSIAEELGITSAVAAYYQGVPPQDIA